MLTSLHNSYAGGGRFEGGRGGGRGPPGGGGRGGPADYHDVSREQGMQMLTRALGTLTLGGPKQVSKPSKGTCFGGISSLLLRTSVLNYKRWTSQKPKTSRLATN